MYFSLSPPKRNIRVLETPPGGYSCTSPSRHKSSKQKMVINRAGEGVRMGLCANEEPHPCLIGNKTLQAKVIVDV